MMAYQRDLVLAILYDGSPVREIHGTATIPYHKEYKIRLKNKHSNLRAKARVWIDGRKVSGLGDFILQPGATLDLERFLDSSLDSGNRFKFVPLSDSRVNDPTDGNNGMVKVEFYRESINWERPIFPVKPYRPGREGQKGNIWYYDTHPVEREEFTSGTIKRGFGPSTTGTSSTFCLNSVTTSICDPHVTPDSSAGATVEGGFSNQKFSYGDHFDTETLPVTLTIRLKAPKSRPVEISHKRPKRSRHCTNCGEPKRRRSDKFCANCGTKFNNYRRTA